MARMSMVWATGRRVGVTLSVMLMLGCTPVETLDIPDDASPGCVIPITHALHRIQINGPIELELLPGTPRLQWLAGPEPRMSVMRQSRTLNMALGYAAKPCKMRLFQPHLPAMTLAHQANIQAKHLKTTRPIEIRLSGAAQLSLQGGRSQIRTLVMQDDTQLHWSKGRGAIEHMALSDRSRLRFTGELSLHRLYLQDDARIQGHWVQSQHVLIRAADRAHLQLSGVTQLLDVQLLGQSHGFLRYLRAQETFAKTHHRAELHLASLQSECIQATDRSQIFYYHDDADRIADEEPGAQIRAVY